MTYSEFQDLSEVLVDARMKALKRKNKQEARKIIEMETILATLVEEENSMSGYHNEHKFGKHE
jgi:hypothetical protein